MSNSETDGPSSSNRLVAILGLPGVKMVTNYDADGRVMGGEAISVGMKVDFQNGPRGYGDDGLLERANGAFVETLLVAARSRLQDYQKSGMSCPENKEAIDHINQALDAQAYRRAGRAKRGIQGSMRQ